MISPHLKKGFDNDTFFMLSATALLKVMDINAAFTNNFGQIYEFEKLKEAFQESH